MCHIVSWASDFHFLGMIPAVNHSESTSTFTNELWTRLRTICSTDLIRVELLIAMNNLHWTDCSLIKQTTRVTNIKSCFDCFWSKCDVFALLLTLNASHLSSDEKHWTGITQMSKHIAKEEERWGEGRRQVGKERTKVEGRKNEMGGETSQCKKGRRR